MINAFISVHPAVLWHARLTSTLIRAMTARGRLRKDAACSTSGSQAAHALAGSACAHEILGCLARRKQVRHDERLAQADPNTLCCRESRSASRFQDQQLCKA